MLPPLKILQDQFQEVSDDHKKNQEIIRGLDERMGNFALKYEIMEYGKELKTLCKQDDYEEFRNKAQKELTNH